MSSHCAWTVPTPIEALPGPGPPAQLETLCNK